MTNINFISVIFLLYWLWVLLLYRHMPIIEALLFPFIAILHTVAMIALELLNIASFFPSLIIHLLGYYYVYRNTQHGTHRNNDSNAD